MSVSTRLNVGIPDRRRHLEDESCCSLTPTGHAGMLAAVAAWQAIEQAEPEFAARVRRLFDAGRHKTIRAAGTPRTA